MSEDSRGLVASSEQNKVGPNYFAFYTREVAELLLQDEKFPFSSQSSDFSRKPCAATAKNSEHFTDSGSLFCNAIGPGISDFTKERLKAALRQGVVALTEEVDEMLDPVLSMCRIKAQLRCNRRTLPCSGAASNVDEGQTFRKKLRMSSCSSSIGFPKNGGPVMGGSNKEDSGSEHTTSKSLYTNFSKKKFPRIIRECVCCHSVRTPQWRRGPDGVKNLCNACGLRFKKGPKSFLKELNGESILGSDGAEKQIGVNNDLQIFLENDRSQVEEAIKKHNDELSATLEHMEQQLGELLDTVMSQCRPMTLVEKQQLLKMIQKLPPENLDRVVNIIQCKKPSEVASYAEIYVDLGKEDNVTLWRLYYYVEAVENARKLASLS